MEFLNDYLLEDCVVVGLDDDEEINEDVISQLYEDYLADKKEKQKEMLEDMSAEDLEKSFLKKMYEKNFFEKYRIILNLLSEKELRLLFRELQRRYDLGSLMQAQNPTKETLEEQRKHHTIKELAEIYQCSESTIKRRLGTKK